MTNIYDLPLETFIEILSKLDGCTLGKCRRVSKKWKDTIDDNDHLWSKMCEKDFKYSSKIAKRKCGNDCPWYNLYKNLTMWKNPLTPYQNEIKEFYNFSLHDKSHALDVNYGVLPLKDKRGIVLYDTSTLKYIPVVVPEKNCLKIANNDHTSILLLKTGLLLQRTVSDPNCMTEAFFKADNFVLSENALYFYNNRDVYRCDLNEKNLSSKLILHCDYDIKEMQYFNTVIYLFTDCGKIVSIDKGRNVIVKPINCPIEWVKQIKHISAIDDHNFICYSRTLFKVETDKYKHLYLDSYDFFPLVTALFFYGDLVLIGTKPGEIMLYRLSSQKRGSKPIFEMVAVLPDGKFAVHLDVCERKSGPVIIAATFFEIMLIEIVFFPQEKCDANKRTFTSNKVCMYKRLLRLKERLHMNLFNT